MDKKNYEKLDYYYEDIEIARNAIRESLLYPTGEILFDLYAIPSHNHQAFYALIYKKNDGYEMVYARSEIYTMHFECPIKMYYFKWTKEASSKPHSDGRIIIGIAKPSKDFVDMLNKVTDQISDGYYSNGGFIIDGMLQAIRAFKDDTVKEILYYNTDTIPNIDEDELKDFMENMYLIVEDIISKGDGSTTM